MAILSATGIVMRLWLGPLADSAGRKLPMLLGGAALALGSLLMPLADSLTAVALLRVCQAFGLAGYLSAASALLLDIVPREHRGTALGLNRGAVALAVLLFPATAEAIIGRWGYDLFFLLSGGAALAGLALLFGLPVARPHPAGGLLRAAWRPADLLSMLPVLRYPAVPASLVGMAATALAFSYISSYLPLYLADFGQPFTPYFLASGLASFLGGLAGGASDRFGAKRVAGTALAGLAIGCLILIAAGSLLAVIPAGLLVGAAHSLTLSSTYGRIAEEVPDSLRGAAMALCETALDGGVLIGFPALGALTGVAGYGWAFTAAAGVAVLAAAATALAPDASRG